jgi:hypothetical protein
MAVAILPVATVTHDVQRDRRASAEIDVGRADAGVNDVGIDARSGGVVGVGSIER